ATAAGKPPPATVFVIGGGVAGLAAIGTAASLGAHVRAFDVRPEAGEQIESMGATFVQAKAAQQAVSTDGYASELTAEQERATAEMYAAESAQADIVITTALVRGRAPRTLTAAMIAAMKPGSVIVDLAASGGGNAEGTVPGERAVSPNGVILLGYTDLPGRMPAQTSQLYGTNLVNLLNLMTPDKDGQAVLDLTDEVIRGMTIAHDGAVLWPPPPVAVSAAQASAVAAPTPEEAAAAKARFAQEAAEAARRKGLQALFGGAFAAVALMLLLTFGPPAFLGHLTVFALACVIGFYLINGVAAALHTPLMSHTNAVSGIVLVGAMLQIGSSNWAVTALAFIAATIAAVNIFGGFLITRRMIAMFRKDPV
ncbi:MAG: Re/Si-specific NAD(P)(+) transhydrogenase subunit alpha, partial [Promicromonosporaceae bacterium]|nr:Re/Si-specific NAD(P)(+) transhydrogenase subunit alpha [Promicromonosporaceae bacterium]